jgi:cell division protein DivIC
MEKLKRFFANKYVRNKYVITFFVFLIYFLFLDDMDIFMLVKQRNKLNKLKAHKVEMTVQLLETKKELKMLNNLNTLEAYARSEKFFKQKDEDIFVISYE